MGHCKISLVVLGDFEYFLDDYGFILNGKECLWIISEW